MLNKNVQILSVEGKDVLSKYFRTNDKTVYKGSLDDAMEVDKLKTINKNIIKYSKVKNRLYSDDILTVTFEYACKGDKDLTDEEYERVESLKLALTLLDPKVQKEEVKYTKELLKLAERKINKKNIRSQLYKYGFNININGKNKHFVRYKRTSGSARVGKCLFINSKFAKQMLDWSFSGINHETGTEMDCAGMEAYISLPTSSAIDRLQLYPENILLIDDCYSEFEDTVMATELINQQKDEYGNVISGDLYTNVKTTKIKNSIFDGESLLDKSIFEKHGYECKATLQLRNRFFKGIGINTDIQQFFKDNNITKVEQLNGKTVATDISQIKLITTPSSVKYLKFGTYETWLDQIEENWAICKYEKPQHHFNGMVQTHYQLLNTLGMSKLEMENFLKDTIDYINLLKTDISVFKYHLGINSKAKTINDIEERKELDGSIETSNDFILNMLEINEDFEHTKICKKYKNESIHSYISNVRKGHVLVNGNYSVIVSCPYEYLLASIGKFDGSSQLKPFECVSSKFQVGEDILGVRSPEPTMSNVIMFKNVRNNNIDKYFNTESEEVCYISPINNNCMSQMSGLDFDGDSSLLTNNEYLIKSYKENILINVNINGEKVTRFPIPTDFTPKSTIKRKYTSDDLCDTDIKCSSNKIGEIINLAQMLNSVYWDNCYNGVSENELFELYKDISKLTTLSEIEIDRCKKISPVDAKKELDKIRQKYDLGRGEISRNKQIKEVGVRPKFFKYLDGGKDYKFKKFNTGMDYLNEIIDKKCKRNTEYKKEIQFYELLVHKSNSKYSRKTVDTIKKYIKSMDSNVKSIFIKKTDENKMDLYLSVKEETINKIKKTNITPEVIYILMKRVALSNRSSDYRYKEYKKIGRLLLNVIYEADKGMFLKNIKIKTNDNSTLIRDNEGNISIYGVNFRKHK